MLDRSSPTYLAVPPGETLREQLLANQMSQKELAARLGCSQKFVSQLLNGHVTLTTDIAFHLEDILGISAQTCLNLEVAYQQTLQKIAEESGNTPDAKLAQQFPYEAVQQMGWLPEASNLCEKTEALRRFFSVASLQLLPDILPAADAKKLDWNSSNDLLRMAFIRRVEQIAQKRTARKVDLPALRQALDDLRKLAHSDFNTIRTDLADRLAACGIVLVLISETDAEFPASVSFLCRRQIVIGLAPNHQGLGRVWKTLFTELGLIFGECLDKRELTEHDREEADFFATRRLIPTQAYETFTTAKDFSPQAITAFADAITTAPDLVIDRLLADRFIADDGALASLRTTVILSD